MVIAFKERYIAENVSFFFFSFLHSIRCNHTTFELLSQD